MTFRKRDPFPYHSSPDVWDKLKPLVRQMRLEPTQAEQALWTRLRNRQLLGLKFRRQYAIDKFIADFCCLENRLIIEVDGAVHQYTVEEDAIRQEYLESVGFYVIRFTNDAVAQNIGAVLEAISQTISNIGQNISQSPPLQHGEGAGG